VKSTIIPARNEAVFDLLHDYARRLEWDTLLRAAYLEGGQTAAGKGSPRCVGRRLPGSIATQDGLCHVRAPDPGSGEDGECAAFLRVVGGLDPA
jgi:hypothetical protein